MQDVLLNLDGFVDDVVLEELLRDGGLEQDGRVLGKSGCNKLFLFDHDLLAKPSLSKQGW